MYEGNWECGKKNGRGVFSFSNKTTQKGEWVDNKANGEGTIIYPNHDKY